MKKLILFLGMLAGAAAAAMVIFKYLNRDEALPVGSMERSASADLPAFDESELGGTVSPELLSILVCPEDRGPLTLSGDGKWLINPRNGYRYPIRKGIPVMLIEEGRRNRDASLMA